MTVRPTVSVLIPAHNSADTIARAVRSALAQDPPPDEVVVGADGCTDETISIAQSLGCVVVELPKSNGAVARNEAFSASKGDILFLLDADDEWLPGKIAAHLAVHAAQGPSFAIDPARRVRPNGDERGLNGAGPAEPLTYEDMVEHRNWSCGSGISVSREAWERVGGFNPKLRALQDVDALVRFAYFGGPGWRIEECYTKYHLSEGGISRNTSWGDEVIGAFAESCPFLEEKHIQSVRRTIGIRNALLAGPKTFWTHIKWGGVPVTDWRLWKVYLLAWMGALRRRTKPNQS